MGKNKETKRNEALERQRKYDLLSDEEKLNLLDNRLGIGKGARKQRNKIHQKLVGEK